MPSSTRSQASKFWGALPHLKRAWRLLVVGLLCTTLLACSIVQLAYNRAERLAYWWLDDKLHFTAEQSEQVHAALSDWLAWHRQTQLPLYAAFLARAQVEARSDITPDLACKRRAEIEDLMEQAAATGAPHIARVALVLSPQQLARFERFLNDRNVAFAEKFLPTSVADQQEAATEYVQQWLELFYGKLNAAQEQQLAQQVRTFPMDARDVRELRMHHQRQFLGMVRRLQATHATPAQAEAAWRQQLAEAIAPNQAPWKERYASWYASGCATMASWHRGTGTEQRTHVAGELRRWEIDARTLAAQAVTGSRQALLSAPASALLRTP
jgi:Family of unknown function (DUF6279)